MRDNLFRLHTVVEDNKGKCAVHRNHNSTFPIYKLSVFIQTPCTEHNSHSYERELLQTMYNDTGH